MQLDLAKDDREAFHELIDGLLLGDGAISEGGSLMIGQTARRVGWLYQIQRVLKQFGCASKMSSRPAKWVRIKGKKTRVRKSFTLWTPVFHEFKVERARWYPANRKHVPNDVRMTSRSIAHWFAGDGCGTRKGHLFFCTDSFSAREVDDLIVKLPVEARRIKGACGWHIHVTKYDEAFELARTIRQRLPRCCLYKLKGVHKKQPRVRKLKLSATQIRSACVLRLRGWTAARVAKRFGVARVTMNKYLPGLPRARHHLI